MTTTTDARTTGPGWADLPAALGRVAAAGAQAPPDAVVEAVVGEWAAQCGAPSVRAWLVDHQHRWLRVPGPGGHRTDVAGASATARAFRTARVHRAAGCVHVPLQLRGHRWGVLEVVGAQVELTDDEWGLVAATMATALQAAAGTSDRAESHRRSYDYSVAAERQWAVLPPLEQHHGPLWVGALVEPAHVATSDLFDWSVDGDEVSACLVECAGSSVPDTDTSLAVAAARQARRTGLPPLEQVRAVDDVLARAGAVGHLRGVFFWADRVTCEVQLVVAGAPLLWRSEGDGGPARRLRPPSGPLLGHPGQRTSSRHVLEPGAALLALSDGVLAAGVDAGRGLAAAEIGQWVASADSAPDAPRALLDEVRRRAAPTGLPDDATCLVVGRDPSRTG